RRCTCCSKVGVNHDKRNCPENPNRKKGPILDGELEDEDDSDKENKDEDGEDNEDEATNDDEYD
ncbi:hypothetical protein IFM89_003493, partial [Coptis chinensis]